MKNIFGWLLITLFLSVSVRAHGAARIYRIGFLGNVLSTRQAELKSFENRMRELGYVEGKDFTLELRDWQGKVDRSPALADELVALKCDVIVASGTESAYAARNATKTIPIVLAFGADVLRLGFVTELAHPNGNITGMTSIGTAIAGKRVELLKEILPNLSKLAYFWSSTNPSAEGTTREVETVARSLRLNIQSYDIKEPEKLDSVFRSAKKYGAQAMMLGTGGFFGFHQKQIIDLATKHRLPTMYGSIPYVDTGGLMAYTYDRPYQFRRAAEYVDKILKGTKPSDLPVEQPKKFEFVINLRAAKQIGVTIPPNVLARADRAIR